MNLKNKKIIVGVTGSIAAYKAPLLIRELMKLGAEVRVVATQAAKKFVSTMVLENLTHSPVVIDMFDERVQVEGAWHVELAHWCDVMLIAPCSATTLSKLATGNCDNALSCVAVALPHNKHLVIAPAMDFTMYEHPTTQRNIDIIKSNGAKIIYPDEGELASGLQGKGRLPDINIITEVVDMILSGAQTNEFNLCSESEQFLRNKKILITAGATQEKIDDVRYISNYSTGKMGYALASVATKLGADVTLISGKTQLTCPHVNKHINVVSAEEMFNTVTTDYQNYDVIIMAAAVADFEPLEKVSGKIKKQNHQDTYSITLKKTKDILKWLGDNINNEKTFLVGFALEAEDEIENGKRKLIEKKCDMIVVNAANKPDSGFESDNNTISIITRDEKVINYDAMSKEKCAYAILNKIADFVC